MKMYIGSYLTTLLVCLLKVAAAARNAQVYCGACIAMVDEMNWEISKVDPKKTIEVGSYRVDSHGKQNLREIPLARSELHLTDVFETICDNMKDYAETVSDEDMYISYIRTSSRTGGPLSLSNIHITGETHKALKYACETIVEDHEEDIMKYFQQDANKITETVCVQQIGICSEKNVTDQKAAASASILGGLKDLAEQQKNEAKKGQKKEEVSAEDEEDMEEEVIDFVIRDEDMEEEDSEDSDGGKEEL